MRTINPSGAWISLITLSMGTEALILGDGASKAFSNLGGSVMIRVMGACFVVGAVLLFWGIWRDDEFWRSISCIPLGLGMGIYSTGAFLGLHSQGLISGQLSLMMLGIFFIHIGTILKATRKKKG